MSALLSLIREVYPKNSLLITFDISNVKMRLPHHIDFHIQFTYQKNTIFQIVVDEGDSICIMSLSCWKVIGSREVIPSPTLLTTFDFHSHRPHGTLPAFPICVGGKVVNIEFEIVNVNLNYNLLLSHNWVYLMDSIVSSLFHIICFPYEGIIIMIE